jgi:hypothetical protein
MGKTDFSIKVHIKEISLKLVVKSEIKRKFI